MAVTFRHWMTAVGLGCGCLAVAFLPPKTKEPPDRMPTPAIEMRERYRVTSLLNQAERELREARLALAIDSALRRMGLRSNIPIVLPVGPASQSDRDSFAVRVARVWPSELVGADSLRIYLVLQGDDTKPEWQTKYLLPDRQGEPVCVTLLKTPAWNRNLSDADLLKALLREMGPCLFTLMYGQPGPSIDPWHRGYGLALTTRYDLPNTRTDPPNRDVLAIELSWMVYTATGAVLRCLGGDQAECAKSIVGPSVPQESGQERRIKTPEWFYRLPLGSGSSAWLSDLQRAMGAPRFARFWRSSLPMEAAFREAFGVELGAWTQEWISVSYPGLRSGPLPRSRSVVYAGGVMLLCIGLAAVVAERRTTR